MTYEEDAYLDRLMARHPDAQLVEHAGGRPALVRRGQLLVAPHEADTVTEAAHRWLDHRDDRPGASVLWLRGETDACELAGDLGVYGRGHAVAPNHLLRAQPLWFSGPWGAPIPVEPIPAPGSDGARRTVTVAVPDTGLVTHPWWSGAQWYAAQRLSGDIDEVLDADRNGRLDAAAGHGTFIAGVLLRHAPTARLRIRRVLDSTGVGDELELLDAIAGLTGASGPPVDVVCLSSGCHTFDDRPSPLMADALARLRRSSVIVACAGNDDADRPFWPAALKQVIAVAALDADGRSRAPYSNHGWWVDACAPATDIASTFAHFAGTPRFDGYARWSGTSFAAPVVAGEIATRCAELDVDASTAADAVLDPTPHEVLPGLGVPVGLSGPRPVQPV